MKAAGGRHRARGQEPVAPGSTTGRDIIKAVDGYRSDLTARHDAVRGGRKRQRQERHRALDPQYRAQARPHRRRRDPSASAPVAKGQPLDLAALDPKGRRIRAIRGREIAMIFQEPMSSLSPVHTIGQQIIEAIRLHRPMSQAEARARAIEVLDAGEDSAPGAEHRQLSVRVQRRHAPARDDGDGAGLRAEARSSRTNRRPRSTSPRRPRSSI